MQFKGTFTALVTPFNEQNEIDLSEFERFVNWQIQEGISGLVPCGTTGESPTLSSKEKETLISESVRLANGAIPVIAGTGNYNTADTIKNTKHARELGANAALVITPYYNKPGQEGLFRHFKAVADSVPDIDIVIYNVPSRTNVNIHPETVERLVESCKNITTIKEASGDLGQILDLHRRCGDELTILSGEDSLVHPYIACGAKGVISVMSNLMPKEFGDIAKFANEGYWSNSLEIQTRLNPLIDLLFCDTNPIPIKAALNQMEFKVGKLRLPLYELDEAKSSSLIKLMKEYELIL